MIDFQPLVDYLAERLADQGIRRGRVAVETDLVGLERRARDERIDLYIDSPFPVAVMQNRVGFEPLRTSLFAHELHTHLSTSSLCRSAAEQRSVVISSRVPAIKTHSL